jgi:CRISPR-associated protein Cas1
MATLYVTEPGSRIEKEYRHLLVVKDDETLQRVPLASVSHVVLIGQGVGATTPALHALLAAGVTLSLVSARGELLGRLTAPSGKNLELRRRQYGRGAEPDFCLAFSRQVVIGKLLNYRALALRWSRDQEPGPPAPNAGGETTAIPPAVGGSGGRRAALAEQFDRLSDALRQAAAATDMAALRGIEGAGSKAYFAVLRGCLRPDFTFEKRTRRPPTDPFNALLSLGYTLLGEALCTALEIVGLDPYEGFFHADKYGRPALALDLLEEFRGPVADSLALTLVNKRMLTPDDFTLSPAQAGLPTGPATAPTAVAQADLPIGSTVAAVAQAGLPTEPAPAGCYLSKSGLRVYLREFSERLQATFTHPLADRPLTYQKCLEVQARQVAKVVMGKEPLYRPLRVR